MPRRIAMSAAVCKAISNKQAGVIGVQNKLGTSIRLEQALITSRILYTFPYQPQAYPRRQKIQLNTISGQHMRQPSTSNFFPVTQKVFESGLYNTFEDTSHSPSTKGKFEKNEIGTGHPMEDRHLSGE